MSPVSRAADPIDIGSRRELFVDEALIDSRDGVELRMHHPVPREVVVDHDAPWEGSGSGYHTVFQDGDLFRMYYKAWQLSPTEGKLVVPHSTFGAYAESLDGIHWTKPELGLFEFQGSKENNIVWTGKGSHDFTPFRDTNPDVKNEALYKAVGYGPDPRGLYGFQSPDGIHWKLIREAPLMTKGAFDTQNLAFWDSLRKEYRAYVRDFHKNAAGRGIRDIRTATSKDFLDWTDPVPLKFPGAPDEQLYTNQIKPYYRAPHIFVGFPTRYTERRTSPTTEALPEPEHRRLRASSVERYGTAVTDGLLMTSRDGVTFKRWGEAFLRPGLRPENNWKYGDNYIAWHVVETASSIEGAPNELSLYATEGYWTGKSSQLRRYTLRIDGFVSAKAALKGGELVTRPVVFKGKKLLMNFSTSGAGRIRVELQDAAGQPLEGFALTDAIDVVGDSLERPALWKRGSDVSRLAGKPVRIRFVLNDADLYSYQFK
jgi:hypothetical protein